MSSQGLRRAAALLAVPLLAAPLLAATATMALAQGGVGGSGAVATYDLQQLPATKGQVAAYSLTPRGDVDGIILQDGTQVLLPPHLGAQLVAMVKPGQAVTIHGLKAQALPLIQALSITDDASGKTVTDDGPPGTPPAPLASGAHWMSVRGQVREMLYGPRGDMNGALLEDGTQVHLPPDQATVFAKNLQPGQTLVAEGYGVAGAYGRSIDARKIGSDPAQLVSVGPPGGQQPGPLDGPMGGPPPPPPPPSAAPPAIPGAPPPPAPPAPPRAG